MINDPGPTKVLFLDIDGVLNSRRSLLAFDAYPQVLSKDALTKFDWVAIGLIRKLCEETDCSIVLSSDWRLTQKVIDVANAFDLPICGATGIIGDSRGAEIAQWLAEHPDVTHYAIVDDQGGMLPEQLPYFVRTAELNGLLAEDWAELKRVLTDQRPTSAPLLEGHSSAVKDQAMVIEDLRMLVQRLARALRSADTDSTLPDQAQDYLRRVSLQGSPLRKALYSSEPDSPDAEQSGQQPSI